MSGIRVLHVIGGSEFGGIVPYVASLIRMVRDHGGDGVVLATAPRILDYYAVRNIDVVPIRGIDRPVNPLKDAAGLWRLVRYLRRNSFDVVHTHTSKGGIIGRLGARIARTPVVIHTTQGYAFSDYATHGISRRAFLQAERAATRWCDFIIAANEADRVKAIEARIVGESKIVTIPNGINLEEADHELALDPTAVTRDLGLREGMRTVGVMARLAPQKGIEYFIDAIPIIATAHPDAQFLIVGTGEQEALLRERSAAGGYAARVQFAGFRTDWFRVLKAIDVFVMPSLWEGLPITLLGAMAASRPIVATRIKGIIDVCAGREVALLVEPGDSAALARAVNRLLADENLAGRVARAARHHVEEHFSDRTMARRTWEIYASLVAMKGTSKGAA